MFSLSLLRFTRFATVLCVLLAVVWISGCPSTPSGGGGGGGQPTDTDGDGVNDDLDQCPGTASGLTVDATGCPVSGPGPGENDADGDGVPDEDDDCPNTPPGEAVNAVGCPVTTPVLDGDGDGVPDEDDDCPNTPPGEAVNAVGCPVTTPVFDSDGDGVIDNVDECANTAANVTVDEVGCPVSQGGPDTDGDGVNDDIDQCAGTAEGIEVNFNGCPDSDGDGVFDEADDCLATPAGAEVDDDGCAASQRDTDGDGVTDDLDDCPGTGPREDVDEVGCPIGNGGGDPVCGDGIRQSGEACDDGNTTPGDGCDASCQLEPGVCGDGTLNSGEQCDDGNTTPGDGCDGNCQNEAGPTGNDTCANPTSANDGTVSFSTAGATTDSIAGGGGCAATVDMLNDVWFCYVATCSGTATVSLCGSGYDSTVYVYSDCACPTTAPLVCNDDGCGNGVDLRSSRTTFPAVAGASYMIRIGGFEGATGTGSLTLFCGNNAGRGPSACGTNTNNCEGVNNSPACGDQDCCESVCLDIDPYCCDVEWDTVCAEEGTGICGAGFTACGAGAGDCFTEHVDQSPGCSVEGICQTVCESDPFCCLDYWDDLCAESAVSVSDVLAVCQTATGSCTQEHATAGCSNLSCCELVCLQDSFCCTDEWDQSCIDIVVANPGVCR